MLLEKRREECGEERGHGQNEGREQQVRKEYLQKKKGGRETRQKKSYQLVEMILYCWSRTSSGSSRVLELRTKGGFISAKKRKLNL